MDSQLFGDLDEINVFDYHIQLIPSEAINSFVYELKSISKQIYAGMNTQINTNPHISLLQFRMDEKYEESLMKCLKKATENHSRLCLLANDFVNFRGSNTICIKLENQEDTFNFVSRLKIDLKIDVFRNLKFLVTKNLHITILKNVPSEFMNDLNLSFKELTFPKGEFCCNELLIKKLIPGTIEKVGQTHFPLS